MKTKTKNPAAVSALLADDRNGAQLGSECSENVKPLHTSPMGASLGIALMIFGGSVAGAQTWDSSTRNPYVAAGYSDQCTAFAWGRYKVLNGESLTFTRPNGSKAAPHGGLMAAYADETATSYRDSVPVRGALVSWSYGEYGHVAIIESLTFRSGAIVSARISEQNWPIGKAARYYPDPLTAADLSQRGSYKIAGYLCPNRPPSIGSISTTRSGSDLQVRFPVLDEDNRTIRLLVALVKDGKVLASGSNDVPSNRYISFSLRGLQSGSYVWHVWAWDFRNLRGTNSKSFSW